MIKKCLLGMMILFFIFLRVSGVNASIHIDLGSASGSPGSDVTIPITLNYGGATPNLSAISHDITFDTHLLENPRASIGPAGINAGKQVQSNSLSPGVFRVGILGFNQNIIQNGVIAYLTFRIKDNASPGQTTLLNAPSASDPNGNSIPVEGNPGNINITSSITSVEKWSGVASISVKVTSLFEDTAGNIKFVNDNDIIPGTLEIYIGEEDLVPNEDGCYIYFISEDKRDSFCITEKASIYTDYVKPTASSIVYLKGLGFLNTTWEEEPITGLFFLDITKATIKKDKNGNFASITVSGKFGGGFDGIAVFSGALKATLYKE